MKLPSRYKQKGFLLAPGRGGEVDPFFQNVITLMEFEGANNSTVFNDSSLTPSPFVIGAGSPVISTTSPLIGTSYGSFSNAGINCALDSRFNLSNTDWTFEATIRRTATGTDQSIFTKLSSSNVDWQFIIAANGDLVVYFGDGSAGGFQSSNTQIAINTTYKVAATYSGNTLRFFINGNLDKTVTVDGGLSENGLANVDPAKFSVGWTTGALTQYFPGQIDSIRITKGVARYTSSYTPRTTAFPRDGVVDTFYPNTSLLMLGESGNGGTVFKDSSKNNLSFTRYGNVIGSSTQFRNGFSSIFFDGSGDALVTPHIDDLHLNTSFTIDGWVFPTAANVGNIILNKGGGLNIAWASYQLVFDGTFLNFSASSNNAGYDIGSETGATGRIGTVTLNAWNHFAVTLDAVTNTYRGFLGGVQGYTQTSALRPYNSSPRGLAIGGSFENTWNTGTPVNSMTGYLDNIRITKNVARFTQNFTVPERAPAIL